MDSKDSNGFDWDHSAGYVADVSDEEKNSLWKHSEFLESHPAHLFVPTSGTSGAKKWVALPLAGLRRAARSFNRFFELSPQDTVLNPLPLSHIGGLMSFLRAVEGDYNYIAFTQKWNPQVFHRELEKSAATLSSLVPTQVHDLVAREFDSPATLKSVVIGGARLDAPLARAAKKLSWPLMESYGATETGALMAVVQKAKNEHPAAAEPLSKFQSLEHVTLGVSENGTLIAEGPAVASAVLNTESGDIQKLHQKWESRDLAEVDGNAFRILGREDDIYKNKGRKMSHHLAHQSWAACLQEQFESKTPLTVLLTTNDVREGEVLMIVAESHDNKTQQKVEHAVTSFNEKLLEEKRPQWTAIKVLEFVEKIPRLENSKIDYQALKIIKG
jgi:O-succinylbenzoic acid--CoA ligase